MKIKANLLKGWAFLLLAGGAGTALAQTPGPKSSARIPVTTKTAPETAKVTTKTNAGAASTASTPLWKQRIIMNTKTGERTTIENVMAQKTTATTTVNGMPAPGGGYYYTPGPYVRPPSTSSSSGGAVVNSSANSGGLGFINPDLMGGGMMLLSGASLFQPLARFGNGPNEEVCLECAEQSSVSPPIADPNIVDQNRIPPTIPHGNIPLQVEFGNIGDYPFKGDDPQGSMYFTVLYDAVFREPFSEISKLAADEMNEMCPNYSNLSDIQQKALVMLMFSELMRNQERKYDPQRIVTFKDSNGHTQKGHGLCALREEFVKTHLRNEYQDFLELHKKLHGLSYVDYNNVQDLYNPSNNIRLCVMEIYYNATTMSQNPNVPKARPFSQKLEFMSDSKTKEKFQSYSICKKPQSSQ